MSKVKKGNSSWKPASVTDVRDKDPNFRYRWAEKNPDNIAKKKMEGWENALSTETAQAVLSDSRIDDGKNLTTTQEKRDLILMRMPEEKAKERDAYYAQENERRVSGLTAHIKKEAAESGAQIHGEITISSRRNA